MAQAMASSSRLIFIDENGQSMKIWLDPDLPSFIELAPLLRLNGAILTSSPADATILIPYPKSSMDVVNHYCHPSWLPKNEQFPERPKEWEGKIILTERWPRLCEAAGRMMGASENWGKCRKGGPPIGYIAPVSAAQRITPAAKGPAGQQPAVPHDPVGPPSRTSASSSSAAHRAPDTTTRPLAKGPATPKVSITEPSTRFPPHISSWNVQYTEDELDEIFRNVHPKCLWQGLIPRELGKQLAKTYPKLSASSFSKVYADWVEGVRRFKPLATETNYLAHIDLFQPYLSGLKSGAESLSSISEKLVKLHPGRKSSTEWSILLGGWLRNMSPDGKLRSPPPSPKPPAATPDTTPASKPEAPGARSKVGNTSEVRQEWAKRRIILAKEFKAKFDSKEAQTSEVGRYITAKYGYLRQTIEIAYRSWRRKAPQFKGIPDDLQPTAWSTQSHASSAKPTLKRKASPTQPDGAKRAKLSPSAAALAASAPGLDSTSQAGPSRLSPDSLVFSPSPELAGPVLDDLEFSPSPEPPQGPLREDLEYSPSPEPLLNHELQYSPSPEPSQGLLDDDDDLEFSPSPGPVGYSVTDQAKQGRVDVDMSPRASEHSRAQSTARPMRRLPTRLPNDATSWNQSYTAHEFDEIFRNAHPLCLFQGKNPPELGRILVRSHPKMVDYTSWAKRYRDWLACSGRYAPLAKQKGYLRHVHLFESYLPRIKRGVNLVDIATELAKKHPEHDCDMWNVHLGDWLRNMPSRGAGPAVGSSSASLPPSSSPPPPPPSETPPPLPPTPARRSVPVHRSPMQSSLPPRASPRRPAPDRRDPSRSKIVVPVEGQFRVLAEMFKRDYDQTTMMVTEVGREVAQRTGRGERTCEGWYGHWLRNDHRYRDIPDELRPSLPRLASTADASSSSSTPRRSADKYISAKRPQAVFTNGEEAQMVEYIRARQPRVTEPFEEDWEDFASRHRGRSAAEYAEHHRLYKARINDQLAKLGGHVEDRRSSSFSSGKNGSSSTSGRFSRPSSSATAVVTPTGDVSGKGKDRVVVDLTLSDEED